MKYRDWSKPHRCPCWSGEKWEFSEGSCECPGGHVGYHRWRFGRCNECKHWVYPLWFSPSQVIDCWRNLFYLWFDSRFPSDWDFYNENGETVGHATRCEGRWETYTDRYIGSYKWLGQAQAAVSAINKEGK